MMTVRTRLGISPIHGIGVFAVEPIAKGTVTWRLSEWDLQLTDADLGRMSPAAREAIKIHTYVQDGRHVLCFDHGRFMNHSDAPNTDAASAEVNYALRDIAAGEELTCDYRVFDQALDPAEIGR
jgi:SET domain-containing protein